MKKIGFDNEKYLRIQSQHIKERIDQFNGKLFMEFGGKLFRKYISSPLVEAKNLPASAEITFLGGEAGLPSLFTIVNYQEDLPPVPLRDVEIALNLPGFAGKLRRVSDGEEITFDRDGDVHYDLLSCLQKSIRGSDPDAAVFYLARLLAGGDLISPCRRLMVIASEDIGPAYPMAPVIVKACVDAARELGLPEARIPLANAAVILATAPKSNSANEALCAAEEDIHAGLGSDIPKHLHAPKFVGYKYPHVYPNHWVDQQYLPDGVDGGFYVPSDNGYEKTIKEHFEFIKGNQTSKRKKK